MKVTTNDGKYTVVQKDNTGRLHALRYGKPWRDCVGDRLIYTLASNLEDAREENVKLKRDQERLNWAIQRPNTFLKFCHNAFGGTEIEEFANIRAEIDAARAKEGAK